MQNIFSDLSDEKLVKKMIKTNWENYHYCLGRSPSVELSIGRSLTWFITNMPNHFMNLVVCTELPPNGAEELIENALNHFRRLKIEKVTWLVEDGVPALEIKQYLIMHGLTYEESYSTDMAADLSCLPEKVEVPSGLEIIRVDDEKTLQQWIHVASIGFGVVEEYEKVWYDFFAEAVCAMPFRTYLAVLNGEPVGTSQLFVSAGVAGIYNVTCIPECRGQGIGTAIVRAPLLAAREMGYRVSILQASQLGYNVYRRQGFQSYGKLSVYLWENDMA